MGNELPCKDTSAHGGNPSPSRAESSPNCGTTSAEAKRLGRKLDIFSFAWQLPECYDEDIMEEFPTEKDQVLYRESNDTSPISGDVALQGELGLLVTQEYRRTHCMYIWRQMHRAFTVQKHIDSHLNAYHHTLHCHHVMLGGQIPADVVGAVAMVKHSTCQRVF